MDSDLCDYDFDPEFLDKTPLPLDFSQASQSTAQFQRGGFPGSAGGNISRLSGGPSLSSIPWTTQMEIIRTASCENLMVSPEFQNLWVCSMKLEAEVKSQKEMIDLLRSTVESRKSTSKHSPSSRSTSSHPPTATSFRPSFGASSIGSGTAPAPLSTPLLSKIPTKPVPLTKDLCPHVLYFTEEEWDLHQKSSATCELGHNSSKTGCDRLGFLEDDQGRPISKHRRAMFSEYSTGLFNALYYDQMDPETWQLALPEAKAYYYYNMETMFPEFRFCSNHWKVKNFAMVRYSEWDQSS
ncbi:hypothetical protein BDQ17DRAFT_889609 [Cyathus striatus]|nr:hypothetical protein BDQ17DRAFT_889609 [Cyathus striatus]